MERVRRQHGLGTFLRPWGSEKQCDSHRIDGVLERGTVRDELCVYVCLGVVSLSHMHLHLV
jgi:hypothetical protein